MAREVLRLSTALLFCLLLRAPAEAQERAEVFFPARVAFPESLAGSVPASSPAVLRFWNALLAPGRVLRISVRAERAGDPDGFEVFFATRGTRGGNGRSGLLSATEFVPVFESHPSTASGGTEIVWTLRWRSAIRHAGPRTLTLRWKVESVPASPWAAPGSAEPRKGERASPLQEMAPQRDGTEGWTAHRSPPAKRARR